MSIHGAETFQSTFQLLSYTNTDGKLSDQIGSRLTQQDPILGIKDTASSGSYFMAVGTRFPRPVNAIDPVVQEKQCWIDVTGDNCF